ncbi:thioredoxin family protein [Flavobacterium sp. Fl-77]|uniref:Thioredoxin family protein n=1 Tax=Flavobacterium flavipigmentatum TaxID=2893884 RepID=A0AAJ2S9B6_9FLAO|nr:MULTISPECIES: thioredoxin family protein [unclassified Flavobacterium]MDX6181952.1 thioredoxin family protein [Flavobacterium sp. Fl-33]MDX6186993.1 thioredoxin family protein [Flavobacterium sp. Fl-77]UFH37128.1 thioredoxin family protein [Flavobacterium sp. F-70]
MAQTASNRFPLGTIAPNFKLKDTNSNDTYSFEDLKGSKGTLVLFIANNCPFVLHAVPEIIMIANDYRVQGLGVLAISSNDSISNPENSPEMMTEFAFQHKIDFPYLFDESQEVAKAYYASCTPDIYLFDSQDKLFYHGQLDDSRPGNEIPLSGSDLRSAIDALIYNRSLKNPQKPNMGCGIKWK